MTITSGQKRRKSSGYWGTPQNPCRQPTVFTTRARGAAMSYQPSVALPPDWVEYWTGTCILLNTNSGAGLQRRFRSAHKHVIQSRSTDDGYPYYYNSVTAVTQWYPPTAEEGTSDTSYQYDDGSSAAATLSTSPPQAASSPSEGICLSHTPTTICYSTYTSFTFRVYLRLYWTACSHSRVAHLLTCDYE